MEEDAAGVVDPDRERLAVRIPVAQKTRHEVDSALRPRSGVDEANRRNFAVIADMHSRDRRVAVVLDTKRALFYDEASYTPSRPGMLEEHPLLHELV